jgi:hypothetical protein
VGLSERKVWKPQNLEHSDTAGEDQGCGPDIVIEREFGTKHPEVSRAVNTIVRRSVKIYLLAAWVVGGHPVNRVEVPIE